MICKSHNFLPSNKFLWFFFLIFRFFHSLFLYFVFAALVYFFAVLQCFPSLQWYLYLFRCHSECVCAFSIERLDCLIAYVYLPWVLQCSVNKICWYLFVCFFVYNNNVISLKYRKRSISQIFAYFSLLNRLSYICRIYWTHFLHNSTAVMYPRT